MVHILFTTDKESDNSATQFFSVTKGWKAKLESEEIQKSLEKQQLWKAKARETINTREPTPETLKIKC